MLDNIILSNLNLRRSDWVANDPVLLAQLDNFSNIIKEYDPEQVYSMDETGLFYRQVLP